MLGGELISEEVTEASCEVSGKIYSLDLVLKKFKGASIVTAYSFSTPSEKMLTDKDKDMSSDYLQRCRQIGRKAHQEQVMQKTRAEEELENANINEGTRENPPAILASNMGVTPGAGDVRNGFALAKFGPPRGDFWNVQDFQNFFVVSADGPDIFYVKNIPQQGALLDLGTAMTEFYDDHWANQPRMKRDDILVGGFYVCYSEKFETWNRCRVVNFIKNTDSASEKAQELLVQLLDYGTWQIVSLSEVYPLRPEFLELPTQVCAASLFDNNEPGPVAWTPDEKKEFIGMVGGKVVPGYVMGVRDSVTETFPRLQVILFNQDEDGNHGDLMLGDRLNLVDTDRGGASASDDQQ